MIKINFSNVSSFGLRSGIKVASFMLVCAVYGCGSLAEASLWLAQTPVSAIAALKDGSTPEQEVAIRGQVMRKVPLLGQFAYELKDGTGSILVVTQEAGWTVGAEVTAHGLVRTETILTGQVSQKEKTSQKEIYLEITPEKKP